MFFTYIKQKQILKNLLKKLQTNSYYIHKIKETLIFLIDLIGLKYLWHKCNPPKKNSNYKEPRTIGVWTISTMFALFSVAFLIYELALFRLEQRVNNLVTQIGYNKNALSLIPELQSRTTPRQPSIFNFITNIRVLIAYTKNKSLRKNTHLTPITSLEHYTIDRDILKELHKIIAINKHQLSNLNLESLWSINQNLSQANFYNSNLYQANFYGNDLTGANFKYAKLMNAKFLPSRSSLSNLTEADFSYSDLFNANFHLAKLKNANFKNADLTETNFIDAWLVGADFRDTNLKFNKPENMKGAIYNSKNIRANSMYVRLNPFLAIKNIERTTLCKKKGLMHKSCDQYIDNSIIYPTKFPDGFHAEDYGMIDISEKTLATTSLIRRLIQNKEYFINTRNWQEKIKQIKEIVTNITSVIYYSKNDKQVLKVLETYLLELINNNSGIYRKTKINYKNFLLTVALTSVNKQQLSNSTINPEKICTNEKYIKWKNRVLETYSYTKTKMQYDRKKYDIYGTDYIEIANNNKKELDEKENKYCQK
ncbi:MAG: pentapeptide repeat-containing protein [Rickettsiales bacterium]|nr:pentapeptide repeat-containing protein [Rickettsiales bacterium]